MASFTSQIWDFYFRGKALEFRLFRYTSDTPLHGAFEATECPEGHEPAGNGVSFVKNLHLAAHDPVVTSRVAEVGANEYRRTDTRHEGSLLVSATLPEGYVIPDLASVHPEPVTFKVFDSRLAFYWKVGAEQKAFYWKLQRVGPRQIPGYCQRLNRALHDLHMGRYAPAAQASPGTLYTFEIWDLLFDGDILAIELDRYASASRIEGSFDATACPAGHESVHGGLAFVKALDRCRRTTERSAATDLGGLEYSRYDGLHEGPMHVMAVLPSGYGVATLDAVRPAPRTFKVFNGRLAFLWSVQAGEQQFYWQLSRVEPASLDGLCKQLNRALATAFPPPAPPPLPTPDGASTHVFRQEKERMWRIAFGEERRTVDCDRLGMLYIPRLLEFPGKTIDDLTLSTGAADVAEILNAESTESGLDPAGVTALRDRVAYLRRQIESRDASEAAELVAELRQIEKAIRANRGPGSRQRPSRDSAKVKAQKRVTKNLQTVYVWLAEQGFPLLSAHLFRSIKADGYGRVYRPEQVPAVVWDVGLLA